MEQALKMALSKCEEGEVYRENSLDTTVNFRFNRLQSVDSSFSEGIGLRVIKDGKIGFSSVNSAQNLKHLVSSALQSSSLGQRARFKFPSSSNMTEVNCFDETVASVPVEQMIEEGEKTIQAIRKEFPTFQCEAELSKEISTISISNSSGLDLSYRKSLYSFSIYAFLAEEGDFLGVIEEESGGQYKDHSDLIAHRVIEKIKYSQNRASIKTGTYPVIFTPKAVPLILHPLKKGINGKIVRKKASPLSSRLHESIFSPSLTITDDATLPYGQDSSPIDHEGVSSRSNSIIENGSLKNFIYDLQTAGASDARTTANARRKYDSPPSPSPTNFIVSPGNLTLDEMVKDIKEGLIIDQVIGSGQSNVLMGEFSVNLDLGFKVEKGQIVGRVKNVMASGNTYDLLKNVLAVGRKTRFVGSTCTPPLYFSRIHIAG